MRSGFNRVVGLLLTCVMLGAGPTVAAYQSDPSIRGITVSGKVVFKGPIPKAKRLPVHRDSVVCGATIPDEALQVDPASRGVAGVVVSLEGVAKGKSLPEGGAVVIENRTCRFLPRGNAAVVGSVIQIKNTDPIMHNTHIRRETRFGSTVINVAQPIGAPIIEKPLGEIGLLDVRCDAHTFMRASLHVFEHPYFAVTDESGQFELTGVPQGTYRLRYWHELFGTQEQGLTVPGSGKVSMDLELEEQP